MPHASPKSDSEFSPPEFSQLGLAASESQGKNDPRTGICRFWLAAACLLVVAIAGCDGSTPGPEPEAGRVDPVLAMRSAINAGRWNEAAGYSQQALLARPNDPQIIKDAARAHAKSGNRREAAHLLVDGLKLTNYSPSADVDFAFQALIDVGELYQAIDLLEQTVRAHPDDRHHRRMLVGMLGEAQRPERIGPHYQKLIRDRAFDFPLLVAISEATTRRFYPKTGELMMERNPSDHRVRLGEARHHFDVKEAGEARRILEEILEHHPGFGPAYALLGQVLVEQNQHEEIVSWLQGAPDGIDEFADYWLTLGDLAAAEDQQPEAARAYWEATRRDPNDPNAWSRLAMTLRQIASTADDEPQPFEQSELVDIDSRVANLLEMRKHLFGFDKSGRKSQRYALQTAKNLVNLGRNWEAEAWSAAATRLTTDQVEGLEKFRDEVTANLKRDQSWVSKIGHPALEMDLSVYPLPSFSDKAIAARATPVPVAIVPEIESSEHIRLRDASDAWGLEGIGEGNYASDARLGPLIRSTGVGGGAIDYDLDGRPDVVVMGAGGTMLKRDSHSNELLRNLGDRFVPVTATAQTGDTSFGQGLAIGDFNEDGFPDLFYANLGKNRLLRNNGDGTFTDCTTLLEDDNAMQWTTCGAFVDIDGDAIADLITTNYCEAIETLDRACAREDGVLGPCHPLKFPAYRDQYFAGSGDGRLIDATSRWIPPISPGRGLGILAGTLDGRGLGIFIANDMSSNEYYSRPPDGSSQLIESASARGVAVDGRTLTQASMGIASGDLDGDGDLDIYVTGFGKEYNIYYEQVAPGLWKDQTRRLGLVEPSLPLVGFGTQAIDLDSDGIDELVVTNGHIGDFQDDELFFEQPFQAFRRDQTGAFKLLEDDHWDAYFTKPHVGRALWTLDANGDGCSDLMLTHTDEHVRLLMVDSRIANHRIGFKLIGTKSSRDAIGAIVRFQAGGRNRTLWSLAGDGYMCANEAVLRAGLGNAARVSEVTVTWPDGSEESFGSLDADSDYILVEGEGAATLLRAHKKPEA